MFWTALLDEATNDVDDDACSPSHDYGPDCPACDGTLARRLPSLSDGSRADYYRCPQCTHVWSVDKETRELIQHVTPLPDKLRASTLT